jgi:hypothetical protein
MSATTTTAVRPSVAVWFELPADNFDRAMRFAIVQLLRGGRPVTAQRLADRLEASDSIWMNVL